MPARAPVGDRAVLGICDNACAIRTFAVAFHRSALIPGLKGPVERTRQLRGPNIEADPQGDCPTGARVPIGVIDDEWVPRSICRKKVGAR